MDSDIKTGGWFLVWLARWFRGSNVYITTSTLDILSINIQTQAGQGHEMKRGKASNMPTSLVLAKYLSTDLFPI